MRSGGSQNGAALLVAVLFLTVAGAVGATALASFSGAARQKTEMCRTREHIAEAGLALKRILQSGRTLPCPAAQKDGRAATACEASKSGFFPWREAALQPREVRDARGRFFFYVLGPVQMENRECRALVAGRGLDGGPLQAPGLVQAGGEVVPAFIPETADVVYCLPAGGGA